MKPVLVVTNHVPPDRIPAFAALHAAEGIELALFGGRSHHATGGVEDPGVPHRHVSQRSIARLASSRRYRAVVCGTAGRAALPAAFAGARAGRVPFLLWTALWAEIDSPAHRAARPLMRRIYGDAAAVVTYGPHVSAFAREQGATRVFEAPQSVDPAFWGENAGWRRRPDAPALWVGRDAPEKGLDILLDVWVGSRKLPDLGELQLAGVEPELLARYGVPADAPVTALGRLDPVALRNSYRRAGVLVVPSVPTPTFREPWGLVVNEAMHQHLPVIATTAVGAAAGGLVRHKENGLVVEAGDALAIGHAVRRLRADPTLRDRLGEAAAGDVAPYTPAAWAAGFSAALASAGLSQAPPAPADRSLVGGATG